MYPRQKKPTGRVYRKRKPAAKKAYRKPVYKRKYGSANKRNFYGNIKKIANMNMTESNIIQKMRPDKLARNLEKVGVPHQFYLNKSANYASQEGRQCAIQLATLDSPDCRRILTYTTPSAGTTAGGPVKRAVLERVVGQLEVTNSSTARASVDIYDIIRIRDPNEGNLGTNNPVTAWADGLQNQNTIYNHPTGDAGILGSIPTDSKLFNDYFKIIKKTSLVMEQGASHRHYVSRSLNKFIDTELFGMTYNDVFPAYDLKPFVLYHMVVAHGQAVPVGEGFPSTTTAAVRIDAVLTYRAKWSWVNNNQYGVLYDNTALLTTSTDDAIVNAGSGAIETTHWIGDSK